MGRKTGNRSRSSSCLVQVRVILASDLCVINLMWPIEFFGRSFLFIYYSWDKADPNTTRTDD